MASETGPPTAAGAAQPENAIQRAIAWLTADNTTTRQSLLRLDGPTAPGEILAAARYDLQFERLLAGEAIDPAQALIEAEAQWLIRRMPDDHEPPALDSAQQAGRAWGILITADTEVFPAQRVAVEVARRTGISMRAADEITAQARKVSAAFARADLLSPYDHAPDQTLVDDWYRLAACGPELPEAAARSEDVLELLTARLTGTPAHDWMTAAARHAAQTYDSISQAQPLLSQLTQFIPEWDDPDAEDGQVRLVRLEEQGVLAAAATAAARAREVQDWADRDSTSEVTRARKVDAAAPGVRTIVRLNQALLDLDPTQSHPAFTALDEPRVAQLVHALGRLSAQVSEALRPVRTMQGSAAEQHRPPQQHQPPTPGAGGGASRQTP
ncbi:hypothetical protein ACFU8W_48510 [Streptomyces sp. NPDC057565]|uniref:hypothetical protein n=1 Tax=Streptomyces sp. NPDC057565 TaxID=3346169 RepID=UPI0036CC18BA